MSRTPTVVEDNPTLAPTDSGIALAVSATADAYYQRVVNQPEDARGRAQQAYAVASAAAAALTLALGLGGVDEEPTLVKALAIAAVATWLLSAGLYVFAVAVPVGTDPEGGAKPPEWIRSVLDNARSERRMIDERQTRANGTAVVAAVLTVLALTANLSLRTPSDSVQIEAVLTTNGAKVVAAVCDELGSSIAGWVNDPTADPIRLEPEHRFKCGEPGTALLLRQNDVELIRITQPQ